MRSKLYLLRIFCLAKFMNEQELIISVYLNQRIVFDLIAMLQDGMSTVTRVSSSETNKDSDTQRYGAAFGLSQALSSLLKIDVSGDRAKLKEGVKDIQKSEERVHTPSSLFQKLRSELKAKEIIKVVDSKYQPKSGDWVEFSTTLKRNPLTQVINTFTGLIDMATAFEEQPQQKNRKHLLQNKSQNETDKIKTQLNKFSEEIKVGNTIDMVSDSLTSKHRAVVTLEKEYLNDPTMADLVDGNFTVIGKVIRAINDSQQSVNLLRKGVVGSINSQTLQILFTALSAPAVTANIDLPTIEWEIQGPVIHVIPIAIFA